MVRSCYTATIRPFNDSEITCKIRWYFVEKGTPFIPGGTLFASGNWATEKTGWTGPGEVSGAPRPWNNGAPPSPRALGNPAGPLEYFHLGAPVSAIGSLGYNECGVPLPCVTEPCEGEGMDINSYREYSVGDDKKFYPATAQYLTAVNVLGVAGYLWLMPWINVFRCKLDTMGFQWLGGAEDCQLRLGLYLATSNTNFTPTDLLWESDEIDGMTLSDVEIVERSVDVILERNSLYFFAFNKIGVSGAVSGFGPGASYSIFGWRNDEGFVAKNCLRANHEGGPLPNPAPSMVALATQAPILFGTIKPP